MLKNESSSENHPAFVHKPRDPLMTGDARVHSFGEASGLLRGEAVLRTAIGSGVVVKLKLFGRIVEVDNPELLEHAARILIDMAHFARVQEALLAKPFDAK